MHCLHTRLIKSCAFCLVVRRLPCADFGMICKSQQAAQHLAVALHVCAPIFMPSSWHSPALYTATLKVGN